MNLPNQFGPYLLLERISVGGMAEVYKAKEYGVEGFERTVAVKRILPHVAEDEEFIAMFKDEAKIAVQLNHGNIAQIYNLGNEQDSFYIALEYVNGRDLRAIFQKCQQQGKPMPIAQACYVIMKICEGLDYAHNKKDKYQRELNIVHRDVSPPNILTSFEGEVKLIDFGVAKAAGRASRTQAGILKGKFGYMSPEQVRGMPLDRRSDVFSVGVVLFEMLTGHRLFQADTDFATLEKVRAVEVPRPSSLNPEIPKPLENIIYKALAREPEQRYQSAIELHDELQAFMFAQGLFYSRKDLATWMRQQYAREIELEKEKDKAQSNATPEGASAGAPRKKRKTMMMPPGGGPPPPPPRKSPPPPPPGGRAGPPQPPARTGTPSRAGANGGPPKPKKVKRKTMVMTTARPNLPPPPGGGPPKPRPKAGEGDEPPTVPIAQALPKPASMPANPRPKPQPKSTMSYAAAASPPASDFDWDDDELETRLFEGEGEGEAKTPDERDSAEVGGAIRAPSADAGAGAPPRAVTVVPPGGYQPPVPAADLAVQKGATVVPGAYQAPAASPFGSPQPAANPFPAAHMAGVGGPAMGPTGTQAMPPVPPSAIDYDDRPAGKSSAGMVLGILAAALVLIVAGVGGFMIVSGKLGGSSGEKTAQAEGGSGEEASGATATKAALTVVTTPADAAVTVDGNKVDGESPFVVSGLEAGTHKVVVTRDGFLPFERDVPVDAGGLNLPVTLPHKEVTLVLDSEPAGASMNLIVNGKAIAMGTAGSQQKVTREPGATYEIEASAKGFITTRQPLSFTGEPSQPVRIVLPRDQNVADAGTTPSKPEPASSGGDASRSKPRSGGGGRSTRPRSKPQTPKKPAAKTSVLKIGTNPGVPPAKVYVDGRYVGKTPLGNVPVTPGRHTIKWQWDGGKQVSRTVTVADGASKLEKAG